MLISQLILYMIINKDYKYNNNNIFGKFFYKIIFVSKKSVIINIIILTFIVLIASIFNTWVYYELIHNLHIFSSTYK